MRARVSEVTRLSAVAVLEEVDLDRAMIWNVRQSTGGTDRLLALGIPGSDLADYLSQSRVNTNQWTLDRPVLSPDLSEYVYTRTDSGAFGTNRTAVMRCASDDLSAPVSIAETPSSGVAVEGRGIEILGWSPDGQQVYYRGQTTTISTSPSEIRKVNRDGTGDTQIWTNGSILQFMWGVYPRISPDGTMIAWWIDFDGTGGGFQGLWVMNEDGTGVSHIYTCPDSGGSLPDDFYGWSPDGEWLLFIDTVWSPSPRITTVYKIRPDGTDLTSIYQQSITVDPRFYLAQGQNSVWLADGSGIVGAMDDGTSTGTGDVGILLTDGSETFTPLSPARSTQNPGSVMNADLTRLYWAEGITLGAMKVVSAKVDGSDYRVDDDMDTDPVHDDYLFIGFYKRSS